ADEGKSWGQPRRGMVCRHRANQQGTSSAALPTDAAKCPGHLGRGPRRQYTLLTKLGAQCGGRRMQYYFFHLMSWPYLPPDFEQKYDSAWVWVPNELYDPVKGHDLYREYINTLAYADELGFDGI